MSAGLKTARKQIDFAEYGVSEIYAEVKNNSNTVQTLEGIAVSLPLFEPAAAADYRCEYYAGAWGQEYDPRSRKLSEDQLPLCLVSDRGRSSICFHPFFFFRSQKEGLPSFLAAICFSGNWFASVEQDGTVSCGQKSEMFTKVLQPGEEYRGFSVLIVSGELSNDELSFRLQTFCEEKRFLPLPAEPIVAWNHWWAYEDDQINEEIFCRNIEAAAELGFTACVLDAGWFGENNAENHWTKVRGDWDTVNSVRFPSGLRALADAAHRKKLQFGLWFEPEGLGMNSRLLREHPEWEAVRDGKRYEDPGLCLGCPEACEWLFQKIIAAIQNFDCDWIKLDYNLNVGLGCNREDHGHQAGDGLNAHLQGYFSVLDRLHAAFPKMRIENCSSGGLRTDLETLSHTHLAFLSDPDETPHSLQCFWGGSGLLHPRRIYHFAWSQTKIYPDGSHVFPSMEYSSQTPENTIRFHLRAAMLHQMGFSRDLTALSERQQAIFRQEIAFYKKELHPFVTAPATNLYHLTPQPLRLDARQTEEDRSGAQSWCAFEFLQKDRAYLFLFCFAPCGTVVLSCHGLRKDAHYALRNMDTKECRMVTGAVLRQGVPFVMSQKDTCQIWQIERSHEIR